MILFKIIKEQKQYIVLLGGCHITLWFSADYASGKVKINPEFDELDWFNWTHFPKPLFIPMINYLEKLYETG